MCAECLENVGCSTSHTSVGLPGLLQGRIALLLLYPEEASAHLCVEIVCNYQLYGESSVLELVRILRLILLLVP